MNEYKYLEIIERALDPAQREVCFTTENAVIAAGAGSGKTQVLATRFAWLVISKGLKASEILTLTFTDKAASEMYQRIYGTLKYFADYKAKTDEELLEFFSRKRRNPNPTEEQLKIFREGEKDLTEDKKQRAKEALLDFTNAHIQTLDSYCGSVVRQCANRYGISPDFSVGSGDGERNIKDKAFRFILKHIDEKCIREFSEPGKIQEFAENNLAEIILKNTSVATPDNYFIEKFENQKKAVAALWNEIFVENKSDSLQTILNSTEDELNNHKDKGKKDKALWVAHAYDAIEAGKAISDKISFVTAEDFGNNSKKLLSQLESLKAFFEKASAVYGENGSLKTVKSWFKIICNLYNTTFGFIQYFINKYEEILSFIRLSDEFLSDVNSEKRSTGELSFTDVTELAIKVLLENEDIRNNEKNAYKKIMIDEFQDNNSRNRDLLYLLSLKKGEFESENGNCIISVDDENPESLHDQIADKRDSEKLFFVGDEKQSIYKFRDADVSVFNNLTKENKKVFMSFNYRSTPELINAFNIFFGNNMGIFVAGSDNVESDFEAHYTENAQKNGMECLPELNADNVPVHVRFINENLMLEDEELSESYIPKYNQIAYNIAKTIRELAEKEFKGLPENQWKWENFAILDRSRGHRNEITKYLNLFNIPYQVDVFKNIFEEGVINDIYNFLRLCVYPSDINAFAAFLCSPFAGVSENALEIILSYLVDIKYRRYDEEQFVFDPLNESFDTEIQQNISDADFVKFKNAREFYSSYRKLVLQQELTKTLTYLWHKKGYKYETMLTKQGKLCAEHFDMLFELARNSEENSKNVSWFIDELDNLKTSFAGSADSDIDVGNVTYPLERSHAVQIMTIHKSKGLQFDHIFVLGCTNYHSNNSDRAVVHFDKDYGLSIDPVDGSMNYFKESGKALESLMDLAEFRRVIYVAITRAVKDVYILGIINKRENSGADFRLIETMVKGSYPEVYTENDYALEMPVYNEKCAFDYQGITPVTYSQLPRGKEDIDEIRDRTLKRIQNSMKETIIVDSTCHGIERMQPSKLDLNPVDDNRYSSSGTDLYANLSAILRAYGQNEEDNTEETKLNSENCDELPTGNFSATDFGTLVHDYLCRMALGCDIEKYEPTPAKRYFKNLSEKDKKQIIAICIQMCKEFAETELSKQFFEAVKAGRFAKPEYEFKYYDGKALFRGSIDLIFENADGTYSIVDYKTDRNIRPFEHYGQQNCYKLAAEDIVPHPGKFKCYLYYLRFKETVLL